MAIDEKKYFNAVLYFAEKAANLGKTKLNKLLYFLDFDHFEKYGESVTGDEYENKQHGPVPVSADGIVEKMEQKGLVNVSEERVIDFTRYAIRAKARYDVKAFNSTEMEMLNEISSKWGTHSAEELTAASHGEAPWLATALGEKIPYALAYYRGKYPQPNLDE